jgi:hypothetical protein
MDATAWIVIILIVVVLVVLALAISAARKRRTQAVQERFGPEYDRAVAEHGDRATARDHLETVAERRDALEIRPLDPEARERYLDRWQALQADFVDHPGEAVDGANTLVDEVMRDRGYPVDEEFSSRAELIAADHPRVVESYRAAHDARRRHREAGETATTEELRRAMVHYRELVVLLVEDGGAGSEGDRTAPERAPERPEDGTVGGETAHEPRHRGEEPPPTSS